MVQLYVFLHSQADYMLLWFIVTVPSKKKNSFVTATIEQHQAKHKNASIFNTTSSEQEMLYSCSSRHCISRSARATRSYGSLCSCGLTGISRFTTL